MYTLTQFLSWQKDSDHDRVGSMKARTNEEWLRELSAASESQADAIADLRAYLLRAALYSLTQSQSALAQLGPAAIGQMAEDCAQDALLAILQHLPEFRGDSKFTTWAYRFAVNVALVAAGARWAASVAEAIAASELVVICVLDYAASRSLLESEGETFASYMGGLSEEFLAEMVIVMPGPDQEAKSRFEAGLEKMVAHDKKADWNAFEKDRPEFAKEWDRIVGARR